MTHPILPGKIAWYITGRFYINAKGEAFDVGYFSHIQSITGSPFSNPDTPGEATAYFTFSAMNDAFTGQAFYNNDLKMTTYPEGQWAMYYNPKPSGNFADPASFSPKGAQLIATFKRPDGMTGMGLNGTAVSILSFELLSSTDFVFGTGKKAKTYNMGDLVPNGVTQFGFGNTAALPPLEAYPTVTAFSASALAIGPN